MEKTVSAAFTHWQFLTLGIRLILSGVGVIATSGLGVPAKACDPETKLKLRTRFSISAKQLKSSSGATNAPAFGTKRPVSLLTYEQSIDDTNK